MNNDLLIYIQQAYGIVNNSPIINVDVIFEYQGLEYNTGQLLSDIDTWKQKNQDNIIVSIETNQNRIVDITSSTINLDIYFKAILLLRLKIFRVIGELWT